MAFINILQYRNLLCSAYSSEIKRFCFKKFIYLQYTTRVIYNMRSAYFQNKKGEDNVFINIIFNEYDMNRNLRFQRKVFENVDIFLSRLELKLQQSVESKIKKNKKKNKPIEEPLSVNACLLFNNHRVPDNLKLGDIFEKASYGEFKLRILDTDYDVLVNCPEIKDMKLPNLLHIGNYIFPEVFEAQFTDIDKSDFLWFKSFTPQKMKNWEKCGEGFFYQIKEEDSNYFLKLVCTPKCREKVGPAFEVLSNSAVQESKNVQEVKKRHEFTKSRTESNEFRIVSYNVLADTYIQTKEAKTELFTFCNPDYLKYDYRRNLLNFELLGYNADIICLQEVDMKLYKNNLSLLFNRMGYNCFYNEKEGTREGCLLIYDRDKFSILGINQYTFAKELLNNPLLKDIREKVEGNAKLLQRLLNISSQIQVGVLEFLSKEVLVIGNTHFYFHPDADHIRLLQGVVSWKILENTVKGIKEKEPNKQVSIVLCGDLNSTPDSGFHQLLNTGYVGSDHIGWKSREDEAINDVSCQHLVKMKSAYGTTQFTNYTPLFKGCIDYIYYQSENIELKQTVPIPSEEILSQYAGIPSEFFPSDHIALIADLKFKEK